MANQKSVCDLTDAELCREEAEAMGLEEYGDSGYYTNWELDPDNMLTLILCKQGRGRLVLTTTLLAIRKHDPCTDGWEKLRKHLGPRWPQDKKLPISTILDSNGLSDALWALRAVPESTEKRRIVSLFLADCLARVLCEDDDSRSLAVIGALRRHADTPLTAEEWREIETAAWAACAARASCSATFAAWDAAWAADRDARGAAWATAKAASAARDARVNRDARYSWDTRVAELRWQVRRLRAYLAGETPAPVKIM